MVKDRDVVSVRISERGIYISLGRLKSERRAFRDKCLYDLQIISYAGSESR